jgi:hypothetical protein
MTVPGAQTAYAVTEVDAVKTARTLYRTVMNSECDCVALSQRHNFGSGLHARTLFGQHELAAGKVLSRLGQKNGDLNREDMFPVQILMKAVVIAFAVL